MTAEMMSLEALLETAVTTTRRKFRVWITGQARRVTRPIRREMKRRAAVEPVIGHTKAEHRMGRNYLKGRDGDRSNAVLAAAGDNFGLLLRWLRSFARPYPGPLASGTKPPRINSAAKSQPAFPENALASG